jgi:hypothetical protein
MHKPLRIAASLGTAAMIAAPLTLVTPKPAGAVQREFDLAGAEVDFEVEKEGGRFEVEVDIDDARPGSQWRVKLWHDGNRYHNRIHTADRFGEVEIDKLRPDTSGDDVFRVKVRRIGTDNAKVRTITLR